MRLLPAREQCGRWWCLKCESVVDQDPCPWPTCGLSKAEQYGTPIPYDDTGKPVQGVDG